MTASLDVTDTANHPAVVRGLKLAVGVVGKETCDTSTGTHQRRAMKLTLPVAEVFLGIHNSEPPALGRNEDDLFPLDGVPVQIGALGASGNLDYSHLNSKDEPHASQARRISGFSVIGLKKYVAPQCLQTRSLSAECISTIPGKG